MANDLMLIADDVKMELKSTNVVMPKNYIFENAVKAAHLMLQDVVDKNKRPALDVCTKASIHKAILKMAILGLNPAKVQCYFTVFGNQLGFMVSQYGDVACAIRLNEKIKDIRAVCIYQGDDIEIAIENGKKVVKKHTQTWESFASDEIIGCYAIAVDDNDEIIHSDFMTIAQVKQSWKQSNMRSVVMESGNVNKDTTHGKFGEEMVKKTILHRICKPIIRSSDDSQLLKAWEESNEETPTEARVQIEIKQNANKKLIDLPQDGALVDAEYEHIPEPEPKEEKEPPQNTCNMNQAKQISALEKKAGRDKSATLTYMSGFVDRKIEKYSDLTADEATEYISMLTAELADIPEENSNQEEPPW